jgi:hypothetical protein
VPTRRWVTVGNRGRQMGAREIEPEMGAAILPTLAFARIGDTLFLCYTNREGPSDGDWAAWLDRLAIDDFGKLLVSSPVEAGPNTRQRRVVGEYWKGSARSRLRIARLTASPTARGAFTALSWLLSDHTMRAFAPAELPEALAWLGSSVLPGTASSVLHRLATERPAETPGENRRLV